MTLHTPNGTDYEPWFVLGAGAMGCLWAAALAHHQQHAAAPPVTLLLRDGHALARYPGHVTIKHNTPTGALTRSVAMPAISIADAQPGSLQIRRLLLSCKAQDAMPALNSIADFLHPDGVIVLLQNGMKVQQQVSRQRPDGTVFCLSTSVGGWLQQPFYAVAAGDGESWLGHLYNNTSATLLQRLEQLRTELPHQAMNIHVEHQMQQRLWQKLAINCAINGLTVIYNCPNGELLTRPVARQHCEALCAEISWLMQRLPQAADVSDLWQRVQQVAYATRDNLSSTLQDVRHGRATEIGHLNGYLCELAARQHLPCPLNQQVLGAVLESAPQLPTTRNPLP